MRNIVFVVSMLLAVALQGCGDNNKTSADIDYGCQTSYQIENLTGKNVKVVRVYGQKLSKTVTIADGEKKEIYMEAQMCGENTIIPEFEDKILPILLNNISVNVYVENRHVNSTLLNKENWVFLAEKYYNATYLLVITNELIESVGYIDENSL